MKFVETVMFADTVPASPLARRKPAPRRPHRAELDRLLQSAFDRASEALLAGRRDDAVALLDLAEAACRRYLDPAQLAIVDA